MLCTVGSATLVFKSLNYMDIIKFLHFKYATVDISFHH